MIDKLSMQHRILIATVLSFAFFAAYDYFFIPKVQPSQEQNLSVQTTSAASAISQNSTPNNGAPTTATTPSIAPTVGDTTQYIATIKAEHYEIKIDALGRVSKFFLNDAKYRQEDGSRIQLIEPSFKPYPLEIRFSDTALNNEAFAVTYSADQANVTLDGQSKTIILTQALANNTITKTITFNPNGSYNVKVNLSTPAEYFITPGSRPNVAVDGYTFHGVLVKQADDTLLVIADGDAKGNERAIDAPMLAAADKYYASLFYNYEKGFDVVVSQGKDETGILFVKAQGDLTLNGYIGPKDHRQLNAIDKRLTDVIEYGWFTFIAKPVFLLLSYIHSLLGNWGWSIVVMTLLIRLVLYPLTYKGMVSMNKMKELAPKVKELQAKYKGEPQKLNAHMMELYKKHGANPMGGCLPILMQIPVFFAIYRVLQNAIEIKAEPWILWVTDLSVMDPYFVLPIAMGVSMFVQQRLTPTNFTDPMQEKIMKFLPLIFTFFFVTFPAGLTLYWFVNNLFSIAQQSYVNRLFAKRKEAEKAAHK